MNTDATARAALVSATATAVLTAVHHVYRLGWEFGPPAVLLTVAPFLLLRWYASSRRRLALWIFTAMNAFVFLWFGFVDGFLDHVLKALGLNHTTLLPGGDEEVVLTVFSLWSPEAGNLFYEGTGVLTSLLSVVALYLNGRLLQRTRVSELGVDDSLPVRS